MLLIRLRGDSLEKTWALNYSIVTLTEFTRIKITIEQAADDGTHPNHQALISGERRRVSGARESAIQKGKAIVAIACIGRPLSPLPKCLKGM